MLVLLFLSLLGVLYSSECQNTGTHYTTNTHFIMPNSTPWDCYANTGSNLNQGFVGCETINDTLNNTLERNTTMVFLPGIHNLTKDFTMEDKFAVIMTGYTLQKNNSQLILYGGGIVIQNSVKYSLFHLSISSFSSQAVLIKNVTSVAIDGVTITASAIIIQCIRCNAVTISNVVSIGSVLVIAWPEYYLRVDTYVSYESVVIKNSVFHLAPVGNGISCCNVKSLLIQNVFVSDLTGEATILMPKPPESSLVTFCAHYPWGVAELEICDLITTGISMMKVHNSTFKRTTSTGLCIKAPLNAFVIV